MSDPSDLMRQLDDLHQRIQSYLDSWRVLPQLFESAPVGDDANCRPLEGDPRR
jgi:hypothetical protein